MADDPAPTLDVFGATLSVLSDGRRMAMVVAEQAVPPGYGVPMHVHAADDEMFYLLDGELRLSGPEGETPMRAGACVALPHGIPHGFRNASTAPARLLVTLTPGVEALAMFRAFDAAGCGGSPPSPSAIAAIAARHGVRFV